MKIQADNPRIKDITEEVELAKQSVIRGENTPGDVWEDYIPWKDYRSEGFDYVKIGKIIFEYNKWGVLKEKKDV